jgi:hypothetical protein
MIESIDLNAQRRIARHEWRFVAAVIAIVLILTSLPYFYAYLSTPDGRHFMGIMLDVPDHAQYFSWMRELSNSLLAANKMTAEANQPAFFNLLWWSLGHLQRWFGLSLDLTFQLFRNLSGAVFLVVGYLIIAHFVRDLWERRIAFLIMCFSAGFGWILVLLKYTVAKGELLYPLDVFVAEGNTFLDILAYPHFIAAALYTLVLIFFLHAIEKSQIRYAVFGGLFAQFLGWQHAYDLVLVYGILLAFVLVKLAKTREVPWVSVKSLFVIGVLSFPPALYSVLLTSIDPMWREVLAQFRNAGVFTPNLLHLPVLMGPAFLLAIAGFFASRPLRLRDKSDRELLLLCWFAANFLLIYIPTDYQIHLLNGWQIPIAILATGFVLHHLHPYLRKMGRLPRVSSILRQPLMIAVLLLLVVSPTNLYLWAWRFFDLSRHDYPFYLRTDELHALQWLDEYAGGDSVVLSSLTIGQFIPAWTGARAYLAHWAQTLDFYTKQENVERFFNGSTSPADRKAILMASGVNYVVFGPAEQALGSFSPIESNDLEIVFAEDEVAVLRVLP